MYKDMNNNVEDIIKEYGICAHRLLEIIEKHGVQRRRSFASRKPRGDGKRCPVCRKKIDADSRFCKYCGTDARSEKDILIDRIDKARSAVMLMPQTSRDELMATLAAVEAYIRKE